MAYNFFLHGAIQKVAISIKANFFQRWLWLLVAIVVLALPLTTLAQSGDNPRPAPVFLTDQQDKYPLGLHLELLKDPTGQLTIEQVSSPAYDNRFAPSQANTPNFGYVTGAIWVRLRLRNQANPATTWRLAVEEARLGYVDLYTPAPDGTGFTRQQAGRFRPFTVQDVPYRYGVFNLSLPPDQIQTMYLRVQSASPVSLPLTLWSLDAFVYHTQTDLLILGLFYGAILVMMGHSFFLFASLRDRSYLYLTLFIASFGFGLAFGDGLVHQYLWTAAWPDWYGLEIAGMVAAISMLLFAMDFLDTKTQTPWLHTTMLALLPIALFILILRFFGESNRLLNLTVLVITLITITTGYLAWWRGYRPARYFLLAWLLFLGTLAINFLVNFGLLSRNPFDPYSLQIGMVLMMLLFSLALADRINLLKAETVETNQALTKEMQAREIAQQALSQSERKYRTLVTQAAEGILVMQDGRRKYYNPVWLEMIGYSAEEYEAIPFLSLVYADDLGTVETVYQKLVMGQEFEPLPDFRITTKSGEIKWLSVRGARIEWEDKPAGMAFIEDITERKEAKESLRERKERYRLALNPGQIIVWKMDVATNRWELDGPVEQIFGYTADELGTGSALTDIAHPEDLVRIGETWQPMIEGRCERYEIVHRIFHQDGSVRWVEAQGTAVRDEHGQAIQVFGTTRDITATMQAEERVADRTAELVETNQNLQHQIARRRKVEAALLVVQGQLEQRVADRTAELEHANRQLAALLDVLEERVANRTRQLSAFLDMTILASEAHPMPEVVDLALNRIVELCKCRGLALHLLNDDQPGLTLLTQRGLSATQQEQLKIIPLEPPLSHWLSQRQEPLLAIGPDNAAHLPVSLQLDGFQIYMGAQLRVRENILGILSYYRFTEQSFSVDEISLLVALADQLAIIIENHRLRGHIEEIAVIAERQRLARDLHDSINQSLYSINLFTHAAREASEDDDPNRLADSLTRIESIALTALQEMRLLLYQLQPDVLAEKGLAEALHLRFDSVERRLGIEVDYQVVGQVDLPPDIAEALYRAAMEALNNSLKHAGARHLTVRLTMNEPVIEMEIIDNGHGFEPERVKGGMGLQNIRQRLEQLNGCLALSSEVGVGTTVAFAVSLDEEGAEQAREAIRR